MIVVALLETQGLLREGLIDSLFAVGLYAAARPVRTGIAP